MAIPVNLHLDKVPYRALGNKVLVKLVKRVKLNGIDMPDNAADAYRYYAMSVGPKVEHIQPGDELIVGGFQVPFLSVPGHTDLIVILDGQCFLVKTDGEVKDA